MNDFSLHFPLRSLLLLPLLLLMAMMLAAPPTRAQADFGTNIEASLDLDDERVAPGGTISFTGNVRAVGANDAPPYEVAFYFSDDRFLSSDDVFIGRHASGGLTDGDVENFSESAPLPSGLEDGRPYWVIFSIDDPDVIAEPFVQGVFFEEDDNIDSDAFTVSSSGATDLAITAFELEDEEAAPGDRVSVEYSFDNDGTADSEEFEVGYYLYARGGSTGPPSEETIFIESETIGGIDAGDEEDESEQLTIPAGVEPDRYGLRVVLDDARQIPESNELDNATGRNIDVLPVPGGTQPDLVVEGTLLSRALNRPIVTPTIGPAAGTVSISYTLANRGDAAISASTVEVGYYLSEDESFSESEDVRFGTTTFEAGAADEERAIPVEPGEETRAAFQAQLPAAEDLPAGFGDYHVFIVADPDDQISESSEDNNTGQPQPRAILRSAEVAEGETGTFAPSGDIGVSAEITENGDDTGGGHLLFRRLDGRAPNSTFDGSTAEAPGGGAVTPDRTAQARWQVIGSMLTEVSFRPRLDPDGLAGVLDPERLVVVGRQMQTDPWAAFDTDFAGDDESVLVASERDPVWLAPSARMTVGGEAAENPLPVELAAFTARKDGERGALLQWQTLTETASAGFRIERRREGAEGWQRVAFVESNAEGGTSAEPLRYERQVENLDYGAHVFRLVQRDLDGTATPLGKKASVEIGLSGRYALSPPAPNPARQEARFDLTVRESQSVSVALYDALGREVRAVFDGRVAAQQTRRLTLDAADLASGTYFVRAEGERFEATRTLTVVR